MKNENKNEAKEKEDNKNYIISFYNDCNGKEISERFKWEFLECIVGLKFESFQDNGDCVVNAKESDIEKLLHYYEIVEFIQGDSFKKYTNPFIGESYLGKRKKEKE